jgi:hypothetical protein
LCYPSVVFAGDIVSEITEDDMPQEGEEQKAKFILGPGLRREGSTVFVVTSGILKCRKTGTHRI